MEQEIEVIKEVLEQEIEIEKENIGYLPTGSKQITENGIYDVKKYEEVDVSIPLPTGTIEITRNGEYDVANYVNANIQVPAGVDINDYFNLTPETMQADSNVPWLVNNYFKKFPPVIAPNNITHLNFLTNGIQRWSMPELPKIICGNNITNMSYMYYNNTTIDDLDVSGLDTSNVVTMDNMFSNCINVKNFDLSTFDTRKVQNMSSMFIGDTELLSITFGENFKTEAVTNFTSMFNTCSSLVSLDLSQFYTPNVTNVSYMFSSCTSLTHLDIRNFDFSNVSNSKNFLRYMSTNCEIIVKDATQKAWLNEKFPTMTNVKTVEEYENQ